MRHIAEFLAALCLVTLLLALSVKGGTPTLPAEGAVAPHSTQAMGYDLVGSDGGVFVFHGGFYGSLPGLGIHVDNVVGIVPSSDDKGYFLVGADGGVFSFGDTMYEGSLPGLGVHVKDVVGIVPSSDDKGYFLVGADGGVFSFGDTMYEGSLPGLGVHVDDVAGIAATPSNAGYWVLQANGQVTGFGDAPNLAQLSPLPPSSGATRYVAIASTSDGQGYWAVNNFGQVFAVGDAHWLGNSSYNPSSLVSIVPARDNAGYWIVGSNGAIFGQGDAASYGSLPSLGIVPAFPIVGAAPTVSSPASSAPPPTSTSTAPTTTTTTPNTTTGSSAAISIVGNTCGAVGSCSAQGNTWGNTYGGVPETVSELAVSSDGYALSSASWEENSHNINVYSQNTGYPEGEATGNSGPPSGGAVKGTYGLAMDSTYIYAAVGDGQITRLDRANWLVPGNEHVYDSGSNAGVAPLTVDSGGHPLLGETLCDGNLFVTDSNGALTSTGLSPTTTEIKEVPTSLSGVTTSWSAPGAGVLTCDREGDIWALVESTAGTADELERFTDTGTLVTSFTLPTSVIAQGVAASPSNDELLVPDNGQDQDFKWFNYAGTQTGQVGITGGYLQGSDPGLVGPDRFVGPRSVAIDGSGNIYTAENCMPGIAQSVTAASTGPCAIISEYETNGTTVVWRDVDANTFGGTGEPTADGSRFFDRDFEFTRDANGNYQPYAFTVDPWENPSDPRVSSEQELSGTSTDSHNGATTYEWDADGHRYEGTFEPDPMTYNIFEQQPNSQIMTPVHTFSPSDETLFMDSSGNMWGVVKGGVGGNSVVEYPLTGYSPSGTPQYGSAVSYGMPPGLVDVRRVDVEGNAIYVSGFSSSDTDNSAVWGNWASMGMTLIKFNSLPTTSGWPSAAWTTDPIYTLPSNDTNEFPEPYGFAVNSSAGLVGVTMLFSTSTSMGSLQEYDTSNGDLVRTLNPPLPGSGVYESYFDGQDAVVAKNGWFWLEDDWYTRIIGVCPSGACT
jgi:hypothetical protein